MRLDVRTGKMLRITGLEASDRDWTLSELEAEAVRLNTLHATLIKLISDLEATE